jgi:hypothetical protein
VIADLEDTGNDHAVQALPRTLDGLQVSPLQREQRAQLFDRQFDRDELAEP